jgi:hypothetical protein
MILFLNIILTDNPPISPYPNINLTRTYYSYDRGNLSKYDQLDIFKYSLSSLAVAYPWSRVIIKVTLENKYLKRKQELDEFIKQQFKGFDLILDWKRNELQQDWINSFFLLNDDLIWFCCNHDHIFIDSEVEYLKYLTDKLRTSSNFPWVTCGFSHFSENIRMAKSGLHLDPRNPDSYKIEDRYITLDSTIHDSIQIITKHVYQDWWCRFDFQGGIFPRPESHWGISIGNVIPMPIIRYHIPCKEIVRHFDGYGHSQISNYNCPALDIPPGFFENDLKIRYGYNDYKEGWVNINPKNEHYYAHDLTGTDYKFELDSIPLFWKSRISVIDTNPDVDREEMLNYYLKSILELIYTSNEWEIDKEVENIILNEYLKNYPEYFISF